MTRDELVALVGGDIVGGNVVANNICYGRMTEGMFVLTPEGEAAIIAAAEAPVKAKAKPKAPKKSAPTAESETDLGDDASELDDLDVE